MNLEEERDFLKRELRGVQEMLYQVLQEIGEPVLVQGETLKRGVVGNKQIAIIHDAENDVFIFSIEEVSDEQS